jgi:hypothetical protein
MICVLLTKYYSGEQIKKNEMGGACGTYGINKGVYRVLVGRTEGKRPLARPRNRREEWIYKKCKGGRLTGLIWIRLGTGGGLL